MFEPSGRRPKRWANLRSEGAFNAPTFNIAHLTPTSSIPKNTMRWVRNACDERFAQEGGRFNEARGEFTVSWMETYLRLYEGSKAGQPINIDDWQYEAVMQVFGWIFVSAELNKWIRRFSSAHIWIPKKNKKSPTAAAFGCYLWAGDGEKGQKVFTAAHDGGQALIVHTHANQMVEQSPELMCRTIIDGTTKAMTYVPNHSTYSVLMAKNIKTVQGINGSVMIDEVHVVNPELYHAVSYSGISRDEPLIATFSTVGDLNAQLGLDLYKKSKAIVDGSAYIPNCYVSIFGDFSSVRVSELKTAEQLAEAGAFVKESETSDTAGSTGTDVRPISPETPKLVLGELNDPRYLVRPLKREDWYNKDIATPLMIRANPALGDPLRLSELMAAWEAAQRTETLFSEFLKYRVNQWGIGGAGWIHPTDWSNCGRQYTIHDLHKMGLRNCALGIDLSRTGDMTSVTATFSQELIILGEEVFKPVQITWQWIPQATAETRQREAGINYSLWVNNFCNLTICEGRRTVPYSAVADRVKWLCTNFDVRGIGYDAYNSEQLINMLVYDYNLDPTIMYRIPQTMKVMGPMSSVFQKDIMDGFSVHQESALLAWQMSNCTIVSDGNGNFKPLKPDPRSVFSIDGIMSSIMSQGMFYMPEMELTNRPIGSVAMLMAGEQYVEAA